MIRRPGSDPASLREHADNQGWEVEKGTRTIGINLIYKTLLRSRLSVGTGNFSITLKRVAADRWGRSYARRHGERPPSTSGNSLGATDPLSGGVAVPNQIVVAFVAEFGR